MAVRSKICLMALSMAAGLWQDCYDCFNGKAPALSFGSSSTEPGLFHQRRECPWYER